jgi:hypothetical protein
MAPMLRMISNIMANPEYILVPIFKLLILGDLPAARAVGSLA